MQKLVKRIELSMEYVDSDIPAAEIRSPEDAAGVCQRIIGCKDRENFLVMMLNAKNVVVGYHVATIGTLSACQITPREVFKAAMLCNAAAVILCHNHPSGNSTPSSEDRQITEQLVQAGNLLGIKILDHLVVSHNEFSSTMHNVTGKILKRVAESPASDIQHGARKESLVITARGFKLPADFKIPLDATAQVAVLDRLITILVEGYRLEAELPAGVGRCWATERFVTVYKKGVYVNVPKEIRDKLPGELTFTIK